MGYADVRSPLIAAVLALTVAASGSGVPMCVGLLARAVEPCAMHGHQGGGGGHEVHGAQVAPAPDMDDACHSGESDAGCAATGSCPTGGAAAPFVAKPVFALNAPTRAAPPAVAGAHRSFLSPPLAPPPQA